MPFFRRVSDKVYESDDVVIDLIAVARQCGVEIMEPMWDRCLPTTWITIDGHPRVYANYIGSLA